MRLIALAGFLIAAACASCAASRAEAERRLLNDESVRRAAAVLLEAPTPDEVGLPALLQGELAGEPPTVRTALLEADRLARASVAYRTDSRAHRLSRAQLAEVQEALSCSEFVWLVYSRAGLYLGNYHLETKELAYDRGAYASIMEKLPPGATLRPGDLLVYEYPEPTLVLEAEELGHWRSGHVVMLVSPARRLVIGSHGLESTPPGASSGVGYRSLRRGFDPWTADRPLQAIYRALPPSREPEPPARAR